MDASSRPHFYFHADASAVGGYLKQPVDKPIASRASASLSQSGGEDHHAVEKTSGHGVFTTGAASVRVHGRHEPENGLWRTVVTSTVEHLNISEIVTADRVVAQMSMLQWPDGRPARLSLNGTHFLNLRVRNNTIEPKLEPATFQMDPTKPQPNVKDHELLPDFNSLFNVAVGQHKSASAQSHWPDWLKHRLVSKNPSKALEERGSALCSVVQHVKAEAPLATYAHVIHIPDFGNLFLGELLVSRSSYHLTMVRAELGSMAEGSLSFAAASSNGRTIP